MEDHRSIEMTVIGPDTHIKGEMHFEGTARILGSFEGRISAKGEVQVGEGAVCKAAVEGLRVIVDGTIEGDVIARDAVQLNEAATVKGDIAAPRMIVADGASFVGNCRVGPDAADAELPDRDRSTPLMEPRLNGSGNGSSENGSRERIQSARARLAEAQARLTRYEQDETAEAPRVSA